MGHSSFNSYDVGVSWWSLDHHLGIRHSLLNGSFTGYADLRRYNVIIMPSGYLEMSDYEVNALNDWIKKIQKQYFFSIDVETSSLDELEADLVGISLAIEPGRACYIPLGHIKEKDKTKIPVNLFNRCLFFIFLGI